MSKTKATKSEGKASNKALSKVKDAAITKSSQSPKAKSKEIARKVAAKEEKSSKKKKGKKEPTPEPSSSESESDEEMESSESSSSESESESEVEKPAKKAAAKPKAQAKPKPESDSESESDSDESSSEEEKGVKVPEKAAPKAKASKSESEGESSESESSSSSESSSESDESSSEDVPAKAEKVTKKPAEVNGAKAKGKASSESSDSSEESASESGSSSSEASDDEDSSDSDESSDEAPKTQKRKAESEEAPVTKKAKTEEAPAAAETGNLFVGNLSWNVDEEWLRREFEGFGELVGVRIVTERDTGRSRGFGYVEFAKAADAEKAHTEKKDVELDGRKMNVDFANARTNAGTGKDRAQSRAQNFGDQTSPESDTLFVGNIAFSADQNSIGEAFSEHGEILGIRLPTDPDSGRPKGFGYVQFSSVDEARSALETLQGSDIGGRPIRLDFSTPRQNNGDSPRGGRGGGRGGRGGGRGGRGAPRGGGGRGGSTNRGGFGDYAGKKITF